MAPPHDGGTPPTKPAQATNNSNANSNSDSDSSNRASTPSIPIAQHKPGPAIPQQNNPFAVDPYDAKPAVWPRDPSGARIGGRVTFLSSMRTWEEAWGLKRGGGVRGGERGRGGRGGGSEMGISGHSEDRKDLSLANDAERRTGIVRGGFRAGIGGIGGMRGAAGRGVNLDMERDGAKEKESEMGKENAKDKVRKSAKQKDKEREKEKENEKAKASHKDKSTQDKNSWLPALKRPPQASETETLPPPKPTHHAAERHSRTRHSAYPSQTSRGIDRSGPVFQPHDRTPARHHDQDHVKAGLLVPNDEKEKEKENDSAPTDGRDRPGSPNYDPFTYSAFPVPAALLPSPATPSLPTPSLSTTFTPSPSPPKTGGATTWLSGLKTKSKATTAVFDDLFSFGAAVKRRPEKLSPPVSPRSSLEFGSGSAPGSESGLEPSLEEGLSASASVTGTGTAIPSQTSTTISPASSPLESSSQARSDSTSSSSSSSTSSTQTITAPSPSQQRIDSSSSKLGFPFGTTSPTRSRRGRELGSVKPPPKSSAAMKGYDVMGMLDCERPVTAACHNDDVHPGQRVDFGAMGCEFLFAAPPEGTLCPGLVSELSPGLGPRPQRDWDVDTRLEYHGWLLSSRMAEHRRSSFPAAAARWAVPRGCSREDMELQGRIEALECEASVLMRRGVCVSEAARRVCEGSGRVVLRERAATDEGVGSSSSSSSTSSDGTLVAVAVTTSSSVTVVPRPSTSLSNCIMAASAPEPVPMLRSRSDPCTEAFLTHIRASLEARRLAALRYPVFADEAQRGFWVEGPL